MESISDGSTRHATHHATHLLITHLLEPKLLGLQLGALIDIALCLAALIFRGFDGFESHEGVELEEGGLYLLGTALVLLIHGGQSVRFWSPAGHQQPTRLPSFPFAFVDDSTVGRPGPDGAAPFHLISLPFALVDVAIGILVRAVPLPLTSIPFAHVEIAVRIPKRVTSLLMTRPPILLV